MPEWEVVTEELSQAAYPVIKINYSFSNFEHFIFLSRAKLEAISYLECLVCERLGRDGSCRNALVEVWLRNSRHCRRRWRYHARGHVLSHHDWCFGIYLRLLQEIEGAVALSYDFVDDLAWRQVDGWLLRGRHKVLRAWLLRDKERRLCGQCHHRCLHGRKRCYLRGRRKFLEGWRATDLLNDNSRVNEGVL